MSGNQNIMSLIGPIMSLFTQQQDHSAPSNSISVPSHSTSPAPYPPIYPQQHTPSGVPTFPNLPMLSQAENLITTMNTALRSFGYDVPSLVSKLDPGSVGSVMSMAVLGILVFDMFSYLFTSSEGRNGNGPYKSYTMGSLKKVVTTAADLWEQRKMLGWEESFRNGRVLSDYPEMTEILDSLADAVGKWEGEETPTKEQSLTHLKSRVLFKRR